MRIPKLALAFLALLALGLPGCTTRRVSGSQQRVIEVHAKKFTYTPSVIHVSEGENVVLKLISEDVTHGFYLDGYDVDMYANPGETRSILLKADKTGRWAFRCSVTCGEMHPYMVGFLHVSPNRKFLYGAAGFVLLGGLFSFLLLRGKLDARMLGLFPLDARLELTRYPWVRALLKSRWMPLLPILVNLLIFTVIFVAGWVGGVGPGNYNFGIMIVWIVWWALLMLLMVPFLARIWCAICPLPVFGDWLQRLKVFGVRQGKLIGLNRKWPKSLSNMWLVNFLFLGTTFFTAFFTTRPLYTFVLLGVIVVGSVVAAWVYQRRTFCRYLCPVGGFQGLYANLAVAEVRVKDPAICKDHKPKTCYVGNECGYGCPWLETPFDMNRNTYCGMCFECFKSCPYDNMSLNLRPFGRDLLVDENRGLDEAWKSFIMIGIAILFFVIMQGPWGLLRDWANIKSGAGFLSFVGLTSLVSLVALPAAFGLFIWLSRAAAGSPGVPFRKAYTNLSYALSPVGLAAWWAFSFGILFPNSSYVPHVLSDPYMYGWNLLGTAGIPWTPFLTGWMPYFQMACVGLGMIAALDIGYRLSRQTFGDPARAGRAFLPLGTFTLLLSLAFLWLFIG